MIAAASMPIYIHIRTLANLLSLYFTRAMIISTHEAMYEPPKRTETRTAIMSEVEAISDVLDSCSVIADNAPDIISGTKCSAREIMQRMLAFFVLADLSSGDIRSSSEIF